MIVIAKDYWGLNEIIFVKPSLDWPKECLQKNVCVCVHSFKGVGTVNLEEWRP